MDDFAHWARGAYFDWTDLPDSSPGPGPGRLAAMARPGLYGDLANDLDQLAAAGVSTIVNLTEEPLPRVVFERFRVEEIPIEALDAPSLEQVASFCRLCDEVMARGEAVVAHCHAGIGRTGSMAASYLVHLGLDPAEAIARIRAQRMAIQNPEQEAVVHEWALHCRERSQ